MTAAGFASGTLEYGGRVPVPLTLGIPKPRDNRALTAGLLQQRCDDADVFRDRVVGGLVGLPVLTAAVYDVVRSDVDGVAVILDPERPAPDPNTFAHDFPGVTHVEVDCRAEQVADALQVRLPTRIVVFVEDVTAEIVREIVAAGHSAGIDLAAAPDRIADFLAVVAHADVGFFVRAAGGRDALSILAATVAALSGADVRSALAEPNVDGLLALHPDAAAAVRDILLGIEVDDIREALAYFDVRGLRAP
ncbi:hypothetical protein JGU71_13290 [Antrihabitans sp. YC3-6]|uniref:Uncharacterized protein n=1 Tax=Antrihabitans stalagmiti TaxID=2799499 RepID=A0A934NR04_9NOCA|nr:hypothetical protein [Antrihabitans stalagmiti]MBJ8339864.1 hypothetical protein [Antrihabitans stalagmiti]